MGGPSAHDAELPGLQVRCMAAVLLMVGRGLEAPSVVARLLAAPLKPQYLMAPEVSSRRRLPSVLISCTSATGAMHVARMAADESSRAYACSQPWVMHACC